MFNYSKFLEFPVKVCKPNPRLAQVVITQYGGMHGKNLSMKTTIFILKIFNYIKIEFLYGQA